MIHDMGLAALLGFIEGLTEFIPVSSTGHLILAGHFLHFEGDRASAFEVFIQLGAILAVFLLYIEKFLGLLDFKKKDGFSGSRGLFLLALTTLPALVLGLGAHHFIKEYLFNPKTVALGLAIGGIGIILVEKMKPAPVKFGLDQLQWTDALAVGMFQCLALWPGMSRSASTIVGGMLIKLDRKTATEYSFFAAVPVMVAAVALDLFKSLHFLHASDVPLFATGFLVSLISAWIVIKVFIAFVSHKSLGVFGWYRLALALIVFVLIKTF